MPLTENGGEQKQGLRARLTSAAHALKREIAALMLAVTDRRIAWPIRLLMAAVVSYALSPIDLIPDFIPILGMLDDLLLLPLGIWLIVRLLPPDILDGHRRAAAMASTRPEKRWAGAIIIILIWIGAIAISIRLLFG